MDNLITIVCLLGIICALVTILLNINLVIKVVMNKSKRNADMHLFYYRFALDIFFEQLAIFSAIVLLSIMLSTKLFIWNNLRHKKNNQLSKANRLALLNTVTVLVFDFLPSFCPSM
ncbi:hypothetical protein L3Y34_007200 [Caenorhabditis briggsae]|uniref:Uncharacterized protein n=1 Tax=Caenorhabditis briggsae TaxID=6238 RepID=A0AAE9D0J9_CAEBR|nr:hypothetical protein L3Y34_007200 [Caenorhabditis briggsae]